jgi:predicted nucleic acid binding AN1-type Zn finger protein
MKKLLISAFVAFSLSSAFACATAISSDSQVVEQGDYVNIDGNSVHRPAHAKTNKKPSGATAKCADGTFSFSQHHRGTCSHHGGVTQWF